MMIDRVIESVDERDVPVELYQLAQTVFAANLEVSITFFFFCHAMQIYLDHVFGERVHSIVRDARILGDQHSFSLLQFDRSHGFQSQIHRFKTFSHQNSLRILRISTGNY